MATISREPELPDGYMMDFYPMDHTRDNDSSTLRYLKMGTVRDQSRKSAFETRIKKWLKQYIEKNNPKENNIVLSIAPGHEASKSNDSSFMYDLVEEFITENPTLNIKDGRDLLLRYQKIEKQATAKGWRSEDTHRESICINVDEEEDVSQLNKGKIVIILDDVWTSGCTLRVCKEMVLATDPKDVKLLAIGKTVQ